MSGITAVSNQHLVARKRMGQLASICIKMSHSRDAVGFTRMSTTYYYNKKHHLHNHHYDNNYYHHSSVQRLVLWRE